MRTSLFVRVDRLRGLDSHLETKFFLVIGGWSLWALKLNLLDHHGHALLSTLHAISAKISSLPLEAMALIGSHEPWPFVPSFLDDLSFNRLGFTAVIGRSTLLEIEYTLDMAPGHARWHIYLASLDIYDLICQVSIGWTDSLSGRLVVILHQVGSLSSLWLDDAHFLVDWLFWLWQLFSQVDWRSYPSVEMRMVSSWVVGVINLPR